MRSELSALDDALPKLGWLSISARRSGAIKLTAPDAQPEPRNLRRVKTEVLRRWGTMPLVDMLKETVLRTGCPDAVTSAAGGGIGPGVLAERLLLAIYAHGTNTGIRAVASGAHGHSEDDIRYVRRRYLTVEAARSIAVQVADAPFAARRQSLWGAGSTAVGSDSTHVRALDQNLLTEWHSRYHGRGVLIYWHVERRSMAVHSQLISCSASEVAAMVEGAMRHDTTMDVEANYTDSHGQSEIGFAITRLLGFELLPRIKQINKARLYRPRAGEPDAHPAAGARAHKADPLGHRRRAVRPDDQVRHRDPHRHRVDGGDPAALHPQRLAPHLRRDARGRARAEDDLHRPLPTPARPATRDRGGPERRRVLERRQRRPRLRQTRRHPVQPPRRARALRAVPASSARVHQHPHAPGRPRRAGVDRDPHARGPPRPDPAVLDARPPYGEVNLDMTSRLNLAQPTTLATVDLAAVG
jgi:hypothetical protein